jgi:hypothetical protein
MAIKISSILYRQIIVATAFIQKSVPPGIAHAPS